MRHILPALAVLSLIAAGPAFAAGPCKDAKGKFVKCPEKPAPVKAAPCKDSKGKFMKCPDKPAPAKATQCRDSKGKFIPCKK